MSGAEGEVFDGGRDGSGEGGRGGWDMRILSFARTRTRCTKPNWVVHYCPLVFSSEVPSHFGSARESCSVGQNVRNAGTALTVAA